MGVVFNFFIDVIDPGSIIPFLNFLKKIEKLLCCFQIITFKLIYLYNSFRDNNISFFSDILFGIFETNKIPS